jgi:hypothetical protein
MTEEHQPQTEAPKAHKEKKSVQDKNKKLFADKSFLKEGWTVCFIMILSIFFIFFFLSFIFL